jgi:2-keto-3-deoxy-galactonokinase
MYDVMRGEKTQIWGAEVKPDSVCVLPGTHSKWAFVGEQSRIPRFAFQIARGATYAEIPLGVQARSTNEHASVIFAC